MSLITDYQSLKAAIGVYSHTSGSPRVEDQYPLFIQSATVKINQRLRCREMQTITTLSSSSGVFALPADYASMDSVYTGNREPISLVSTNQSIDGGYSRQREYYIVGTNLYYRVNGNLTDGESVDLEVVYYAKLANFVSDSDTNAVLTAYPTVYLYGSMYEYSKFAEEDQETVTMWLSMFTAEIKEINKESEMAKYSGSPARIRTY